MPLALVILSHFTLTVTLKDICKMGIIRVCKETAVWRVRNFPGSPLLKSGRAQFQTEVCLNLELTCLTALDTRYALSRTLRSWADRAND